MGQRQSAVENLELTLQVERGALPSEFEIAELDEAIEFASPAFPALKDASIFVTGGTGFFGQWLAALLLRANAIHGLGARLALLTRSSAGFRRCCPEMANNPAVRLIEADVRAFAFPEGRFTHLVHGAADTSAAAGSRPLA